MTVLNTNISAQLTSNAMSQNQRAMAQAMERLSTGSRINSASDDAAGLAIVSKMDSQVTGLNTAVKNANDAISMIQTADGATIEIDSMLQRMRELSAQAGNGTNTASDLTVLNKEFANLATEIDRIANTTQFNNTNILDGTGGTSGVFSFQVGANASETLSVDFEDFNLAAGSTAATVGVQTLTMSQAQLRTGSATTDDYVIQFSNGTSMTMDVAEIGATALVTNATDDTLAGFAAVFNTKNAAATASGGVPDITALATAGGITFTQAAAGTGTISGFFRMPTATGIVAALTQTSFVQTTNGAAAGDGDPMAENLSAWATAGSIAQTATTLTKIDAAIAGVAAQRAEFGSWVNRLEHIVDNLSNVRQNTTAARSRIEDADYAAESSELARTQIISQAATAMLSQANQQAQSVLALLR
jgi:flagellin